MSETEVNKALAALIDAHGLNYGDYTGSFLEAWYINIDYAQVDIKPNNQFRLFVDAAVCVQIDLWLFGFPIVVHPDFYFEGRIEIRGSAQDGYKLVFIPEHTAHIIENAIVDNLPDFEVNLGTSILPDEMASLFTSGIPSLTTNENEIISGFNFVGPRKVTVQNKLEGTINIGKVYEYENNIWTEYDSPKDFWWEQNSVHQIKTQESLIPYLSDDWKFINWNNTDIRGTFQKSSLANEDKTENAFFGKVKPLTITMNLAEGGIGGTIYYENQPYPSPHSTYSFISPQYTEFSVEQSPTIDTRKYYFQNWNDGSTNIYRRVFLNSPSHYSATFKGSLISNQLAAFENSSQRKFVRTSAQGGFLHLVYESMGFIWYEMSTDNGTTWNLMNNAKPISGPNSSSPAIAQTQTGSTIVIWQENVADYEYTIKVKSFIYGVPSYENTIELTPNHEFVYPPNEPNFIPNLVFNGGRSFIAVWHKKLEWDGYRGIFGLYGTLDGNTLTVLSDYRTEPFVINCNPDNIAIELNPAYPNNYHLVWKSGNEIQYCLIQTTSTSISSISAIETPSTGCPYPVSSSPSLVVLEDGIPRLAWRGSSGSTSKAILRGKVTGGGWYNGFFTWGTDVSQVNINSKPMGYILAWNDAGYNNKYIRNTNFNYERIFKINNISILGTQIQVNNGFIDDGTNNFADMFGFVYDNRSTPHEFKQSSSVKILGKTNENALSSSRSIIFVEDSALVYYTLGDIKVNDQRVEFVELFDTTQISKNKLNEVLITEPFEIDNSSYIAFTASCIFLDSIKARKLIENEMVFTFSVELMDIEGKTLGAFDKVRYNKTQKTTNKTSNYIVKTDGIKNKVVRLKIAFECPDSYKTYVMTSFTKPSLLEKQAISLNLSDGLKINSYDLSQNFPNPFNPSTTINYQIPKSGYVKLKIYDMIGKEIKTLIDEFKNEGTYTIQFNANDLASGIYFYEIKVNDFTSTKKMVLVK